jgi:hypothetical protein
MALLSNTYDDVSRAARALKKVLDADPAFIEQLSPPERLLANQIRKSAQGDPQ